MTAIRSKATVFLLVLALLAPALEAAGPGSACCGPGDCAKAAAADLFGEAAIPADAGPGFPAEGESREACSCETCQPLFAELSGSSAREFAGARSVTSLDPSDPSEAVSSEIFRPPLA